MFGSLARPSATGPVPLGSIGLALKGETGVSRVIQFWATTDRLGEVCRGLGRVCEDSAEGLSTQ